MADPQYFSQHGEDEWLVKSGLLPKVGTFVEVGAFDGVLSSNTLYFEQQGWNGLLIEADPTLAEQCSKNRKAKTVSCAVGTNLGTHPYFINLADRGLSGLEREGVRINVVVMGLNALLHIWLPGREDKIDLLSIDTEGTELDVWKSIGDIRPGIVIIEYLTLGLPPKDEAIVRQFMKDGYFEVHRTACNLVMVRGKEP